MHSVSGLVTAGCIGRGQATERGDDHSKADASCPFSLGTIPAWEKSMHRSNPCIGTIPALEPSLHWNDPCMRTIPAWEPSLHENHPCMGVIPAGEQSLHGNHPCIRMIPAFFLSQPTAGNPSLLRARKRKKDVLLTSTGMAKPLGLCPDRELMLCSTSRKLWNDFPSMPQL